MRFTLHPVALASLALVFPSASVLAQSAPSEELAPVTISDTAGADAYRAPEAGVGALGNLKLVDTPFSISVLTRDLMDNQQAQYYNDYLKNDPSVTSGNVPVGFSTIRGFSVGIGGYLLDGLPGAMPLSDGRFQLIGVERIDVLKGASAFLYGVGSSPSLGGTINFVPKKPEEGIRTVTAGITSRSVASAAVDLGGRFGTDKQFGYRLNVGAKDGEQGPRGAEWNQKAATLALDWRVNRDLDLSAGFEYAYNKFPRLQPFFVLSPGLDVPAAPSGRRSLAQPWDDFHTEGSDVWLRAEYRINPDWTLTAQGLHSNSLRQNTKEARFGFITSAAGDALLFGQQDGGSRSTGDTAQLTLRGKFDTGSIRHSVTAALTGTKTTNDSGTAVNFGVYPTNIYRPIDYPEPVRQDSGPLLRSQKTSTSSVLLSDIVRFNDQWSALLGLRHAKLDIDNYDRLSGTLAGSPSLTKTTPTAALMYKPTPSSLVYLNYAQGIEMGGTAPAGTLNANQILPPIVTKQAELGAKLETGAILWTAALFDMRRPLEYVDATTRNYVQNGVQRHKGLELTASGKLTSDLSVLAGLMWLNPRTSNTGDATTDGRRPLGVASVVANVFAEYRVGGVPGLYLNGGIYHSGPQYLDGANTQKVPAWTRFDLGVRYETRVGSTPMAILFNVENVADKKYWAGAQSGILTLADPRTFKLSSRFNF